MKQELIDIYKACCNGICPPIRIIIYDNLDVFYHKDSPCKGQKQISLTKKFKINLDALNQIIQLINDSDFWNLEDEYILTPVDLQKITITINYIDLRKTITITQGLQVPIELNNLILGIEKIISEFG